MPKKKANSKSIKPSGPDSLPVELDDIDSLELDFANRLEQLQPAVPKANLPVPRELKIARRELKRPKTSDANILVKPKSQYHHGDLARALIDAAIQMIGELGSKALTLRGVAKKVGVSPAAPYRHFADKETLLAAVAEEGYMTLIAYMEKALAASLSSPLEKLVLLGGAYVEFAQEHQAHFRVMFGPEIENKPQYPDLQQATAYAFSLVVMTILEAQNKQEMKQAAAETIALAFWSMIHGFASLWIDGQIEKATLDGLEPKQMSYLLTRLLTAAPALP